MEAVENISTTSTTSNRAEGDMPSYQGPTLLELLPSYRLHLEAENKSPRTIETYTEGIDRLHQFLVAKGMPTEVAKITREHVQAFVADQLERLSPASAKVRHMASRQFFKWAQEEGEITESPMRNMRPPAVPEQPVPLPAEDEIRALLRITSGRGFFDVRDHAIFRVFISTGARLGEVYRLTPEDIFVDSRTLRLMGKGRRVRFAPLDRKAALALDRYLRARKRHDHRDRPELWLGRQGALSQSSLDNMLHRRCRQAGIRPLHWHQFRHHWAHSARMKGMDDDSTMAVLGWRDRSMLNRYGASGRQERALEAFTRTGMADRY